MAADFRPVFRAIPALLRRELLADLQAFQWSAMSGMAKLWYGNKDIHYEIWVRHSARVVELGLHFESDALTNARLYGAFRSRASEVIRGLGSEARIDQWDKGWTRVWEPYALQAIDDAYADRIRSRFVDYVRVLEPILREELPSDVAWKIAMPRTVRVAPRAAGPAARRAAKATSSRASRSGR